MNSTSPTSSGSNRDGSRNPPTEQSQRRAIDTCSSNDGNCNTTTNHHNTGSSILTSKYNNNDETHYRGYHINESHRSNYTTTGEKRFRRDDKWDRKNNNSPRYRGSSDKVSQRDEYYGPLNRINSESSYGNGRNEWKCLECSTWNDDGNSECHRCGSIFMDHGGGSRKDDYDKNDFHHKSRSRGYSHDHATESDKNNAHKSGRSRLPVTSDDLHPTIASDGTIDHTVNASSSNEAERDEFGRVKSIQPKKIRWPPCFESHGSAFVLDTRSGMFYEAISDFFYDPKSKLYYGNKQGAYFQYDPTKRNFINVSENKTPETFDGKDNAHIDRLESTSSLQTTEPKKTSITINLKTKSLASSKGNKKSKKEDGTAKDKANIVVPEPITLPKEHAVNIEKWSERQIEIRQQESEDKSIRGSSDDSTKVVATAKGEPICLLCRRRFPNLDKLRHHEEVSNLHKENLAKQAATSTTAVQQEPTNPVTQSLSVSSSTYVDRAEQRRQLHDVEKMNASSLRILNSDLHSIVTADSHPSQSSNLVDTKTTGTRSRTLDESNIGHQMLQKLGWKSGNVLGKKTDSSSATTSTADDHIRPAESSTTTTTTILTRMEQDWDRIEAVSKLASSQRNSTMNTVKKGIGH